MMLEKITKAPVTQTLNKVYDVKTKKNNNQDIDLPLNQSNNIATNREENYGIGNPFTGYNNAKKGKVVQSTVFAYPLDIDPQQDHLKIKKYKYERTSVQAGRPATTQTTKGEPIREWLKEVKSKDIRMMSQQTQLAIVYWEWNN